ncbi:putative dual specificity protein phosphatase DSP8 [Camellia lanceoleosa]|uniref:Dual specificity protein phosphatase DSP8 n=1 Tax=Camellia lanceoleosa TaxID=1840588 RepID=A0ACC0FZE5_9ERIC|nr:putative dual specificity protein phosphatase DSP8 [Camellia lanceoleosa]
MGFSRYEELKGREELESDDEEIGYGNEVVRGSTVVLDVKKVLVGAGARALFYPTLLYNVVRNKVQVEFRWWDWIDEFVLLGAVPFPSDVERLKERGVCGVITLNEPYETLVPTSLYLVQHKQMMPEAAYSYVKSIRPRVLLAPSQWQAVLDYYHLKVNPACKPSHMITSLILKSPKFLAARDLVAFDDGSVVMVTEEDLDGYDPSHDSCAIRSKIWTDLNVVCRIRVAGQSALARLSCMWLRCQTQQKISSENMHLESSCPIRSNQLGVLSVDIHVY